MQPDLLANNKRLHITEFIRILCTIGNFYS